jgi:hypothetical protein
MADLNPAFVKQILNVAQRQQEPDIQHYRQADDLRARLEVPESGVFVQPEKLTNRHDRLKLNCSDNAVQRRRIRSNIQSCRICVILKTKRLFQNRRLNHQRQAA